MPSDIVAILDENGNTVVSYGYDAWGAPLWCTGELAETLGKVQPFRYRGYVFDEKTGLYYLRSRYYNAVVGRFLNEDALLNGNLYSYCNNDALIMKIRQDLFLEASPKYLHRFACLFILTAMQLPQYQNVKIVWWIQALSYTRVATITLHLLMMLDMLFL